MGTIKCTQLHGRLYTRKTMKSGIGSWICCVVTSKLGLERVGYLYLINKREFSMLWTNGHLKLSIGTMLGTSMQIGRDISQTNSTRRSSGRWPEHDKEPLNAPGYIKMPARPITERRREMLEPTKPTKLSRFGTRMRCNKCKMVGHNKSSCGKQSSGAGANTGGSYQAPNQSQNLVLSNTPLVVHKAGKRNQLHQVAKLQAFSPGQKRLNISRNRNLSKWLGLMHR